MQISSEHSELTSTSSCSGDWSALHGAKPNMVTQSVTAQREPRAESILPGGGFHGDRFDLHL